MARIKLMGDCRYCLERKIKTGYKQEHKTPVWRDWFFVKYASSINCKRGYFAISNIVYTPKELIGKRIRLKVEVI